MKATPPPWQRRRHKTEVFFQGRKKERPSTRQQRLRVVPSPVPLRIVEASQIRGLVSFGVVVIGWDQYDSYAYVGGTGTGKINPNPEG